jgi:hypothetical protein
MTTGDLPATDPVPDDDVPSRFQVDFTGRKLLGTYLVERKIAEGGMGAVYLARDEALGMRVVVKVPHARFLGEPGFRGRFRREIAELVRLEHPHVVRILARGEEEEVPFFVLQYLGGGSLEQRLATKGQSPREVLEWLRPIASTLDFVHARGVVHRDVKPGNILFDEQGHVFLSDFGVVKALARDDAGERTEAGTGVGSPVYMSPEQGLGQEVTGAADQYALAATAHEALSGEPPFGRGSVVEVLIRKQKEAPPPLSGRGAGLPPQVDRVLSRALSKDTTQRFPSCAALAEAFADAVAPPPVAAKPSRRAWLPLALGALLVAIAVVGGATRWFGLAPAPTSPEKPRDRRSALVVLADRGAEPWHEMRYRPRVGAKDRIVLRSAEEIVQLPSRTPLRAKQDRDLPIEVTVDGVDDDGRARLSWAFEPAIAHPSPATPEDDRRRLEQILASFGGGKGTSVLLPSGGFVDSKFERTSKESVPPEWGTFEDEIRTLDVVFPEEPIGVGAVWDVTEVATVMGIRHQQTTTYTLTQVVGPRARVEARFSQTAPMQGFSLPGVGADLKMKILTLHTTGKGEALVDVRDVLPVEMVMTGVATFDAEITVGASKPRTMQFETEFEGHLRRP